MKRVLMTTAALVAAVAVLAVVSTPPPRIVLPTPPSDGTIAGIVHVHSTRSDGIGTFDSIAEAASRAGLQFVVVTDHGDGTRPLEPPAYLHGVLMIDGVEISTANGHYVALGMHRAPYPLGGEGRDVAEDVARLGGFGVVAHPDSPKPGLRWTDWNVPFDGIELVNLDTGWRRRVAEPGLRAKLGLLPALAGSFVRPSESIARLVDASEPIRRWTAATEGRRVVAMAAADAHGGLTLGSAANGEGGFPLRLAGYESAFRALSMHVRIDAPLSGDADTDAAAILAAIRGGRLYAALNGLAGPPFFQFTAARDAETASAGDRLAPGGAVTLHVQSNAPAGYLTTVWRGAAPVGPPRPDQDFTVDVGGDPAFYWVTIDTPPPAPGATGRLWLFSNPIYVRDTPAPAPAAVPSPATGSSPLFETAADGAGWRTETDPTSLAAVDAEAVQSGPELRFRFGFPSGPKAQQFAALVHEAAAPFTGDRLVFEARSDAPARLEVQIRAAGGDPSAALRWAHSIYLDEEWQTHTLEIRDFRPPIGSTAPPTPPAGPFGAVLFVVDTTNTALGTSGRLAFRHIRIETEQH